MNNNILPDALQAQHLTAFDVLMKQRLSEIELDSVLVYLIDTVNISALYWLAEQFDLMGYKGWKLADTIDKKRELIKRAIELHRLKGTVWAVKESLRAIGYPNATITEHTGHWARFRVSLGLPEDTPISVSMMAEVVKMIFEYKNTRSHLDGIEFKIRFDDTITLIDSGFEDVADTTDDGIFVGGDFRYDGLHLYDGERNYSNDTDVITLEIIE